MQELSSKFVKNIGEFYNSLDVNKKSKFLALYGEYSKVNHRRLLVSLEKNNFLLIIFFILITSAAFGKEKIWIDTDIACGVDKSVDVDDCLALPYLLNNKEIEIVGISTVFGNVSEEDVYKLLKNFLHYYSERSEKKITLKIHRGATSRKTRYGETVQSEASRGISNYFSKYKGKIVLLGPATNLASAINLNKEIIQNIEDVLFVGGNSKGGRRFFPKENSKLISFRDFNFAKDKYSFEVIFNTSLPLHLAGYEIASNMIFKRTDFNKEFPIMGDYLYQKSKGWITYWNDNFNLDGFYPFDYVAVKSFFHLSDFNCIPSQAKIEKGYFLFWEIMKSIRLGQGNRSVHFCI